MPPRNTPKTMGLDMYMTRKTDVKNWDHYPDDALVKVSVNGSAERVGHVVPENVCTIVEDVAYWRKFNALHKWFVDHCGGGVDECQEMWVTDENLMELGNTLLEVAKHPEKAPELLPTSSGFFFGRTDYDEHYMRDVMDTIPVVAELLKTLPNQGALYYQASW